MAAQNPAQTAYWDAATASAQKDNGGTVLMGGNISSDGAITNAPGMAITGAGGRQPPGVLDGTAVDLAQSTGTLAVLKAGHYIMKGGNVTSELAGVAYRGLRGGGNQNQNTGGNASRLAITRTTVMITSWDYATGAATFADQNPAPVAGGSGDFGGVNGTYTVPTRALPGNVVTLPDGRETPTTTALPAKTG